MFLVMCTGPLDDIWEQRDVEIYRLAGRRSDSACAGKESGAHVGTREHVWQVTKFAKAIAMRERLLQIDDLIVTIRER